MSFDGVPRALVGTAGWKKPQWRGHFYPTGLVHARELEYISSRLGSLEINTAFYALPPPSTYRGWYDGVPDDFVFALKANRAATHLHRLRNPVNDIAEFFASGVLGLGRKLGPILWQLPETLSFDAEVVGAFVAALPHSFDEAQLLIERSGIAVQGVAHDDEPGRKILHSFEARNPSFQTSEFTDLLRRHGVARVVTNSSASSILHELTADFAYVRLFSTADEHPDGYSDAILDRWAEIIDGWRGGRGSADGISRAVYVYFANPGERSTRPPLDALGLQRRLNAQPPGNPTTTIQPSLWE